MRPTRSEDFRPSESALLRAEYGASFAAAVPRKLQAAFRASMVGAGNDKTLGA
jgi:hypothetical protein